MELDQSRALLSSGENSCELSRLEYQLMELFMRNPGITFSAAALLGRVWGCDTDAEVGSV